MPLGSLSLIEDPNMVGGQEKHVEYRYRLYIGKRICFEIDVHL